MAEASISWAKDQFMCSVCLDLLKDPVTVPCGHTYCMRCITDCWNHEDQMRIYRCPQCRQTFSPRPVLGKNVMVAEMVDRLKKTRIQVTSDVECDVCTERKHKAIKSCLMCLNSYCQTHLEQHENLFRGRRHDLIDPTRRLQEMICSQHDKVMEIYCIQCQRCICMLCLDEHRNHDTASISAANTEKRSQLGETQNKLQQKILKEERDLQKLRDTVDYHKHSAQSALEDCEMTFTEIMYEVTQLIRDQEKTKVSRAEGLLERQKQKIEDLKRSQVELKNILQTRDNIQFLQSFQCLSVSGSTQNITSVTSNVSFDDDVVKSVSQFRDKLQRFCREEIHKISVTRIQVPEPKSRMEFLRYLHQFTLDPNTVNGFLRFAERNRTLTIAFPPLLYPAHPDRFDSWGQVMCTESVGGRCYWEVEWEGREKNGVDIAVAYKSISRKGLGLECAAGRNDQSWSLFCCPIYCSFIHNNSEMIVSINQSSSRVGVYVDHSAGILSFYRVSSETMSLIHRVHTTFTQPLYPMFGLEQDSALRLSCNNKVDRFCK